MKFKKRYLVLILTCVVCFSFFGGVSAENINNKRITLNKKRVTLNVGKRVMLKLKGAKKSKVKWSCNKKKIARVHKGVVKAKKTGKCAVVAKYLGKKYKCVVTVTKHNSKFESKDITLSLKWEDNTCKSVVLGVFNNSDLEIKTGYGVDLEKLIDGQWKTVPFLETAPPVRAIIKKIKPHKGWTETIPMNEYFGELTEGEYMLSKLVYATGKKVYPSIRFTVPFNASVTTSAPTNIPSATTTPAPIITPILDIPVLTPGPDIKAEEVHVQIKGDDDMTVEAFKEAFSDIGIRELVEYAKPIYLAYPC